MSYTIVSRLGAIPIPNNLFVGGFPWETTEAELVKLFSSCGEVIKAKILTEKETGKSRGIGFVLMASDVGGGTAIAKLNGAMFGNRKIFVSVAKPVEAPRQRTLGGYADKPGFVERRSGKDRRQGPPPPAEERRETSVPAPVKFVPPKGKPWERKPGGFGGEKKKWEKKPGEFSPDKKKWDKKPGGFGGDKKPWDKKPDRFGGEKKWDKKPGGFGGPKKPFYKPGGFRKGGGPPK